MMLSGLKEEQVRKRRIFARHSCRIENLPVQLGGLMRLYIHSATNFAISRLFLPKKILYYLEPDYESHKLRDRNHEA